MDKKIIIAAIVAVGIVAIMVPLAFDMQDMAPVKNDAVTEVSDTPEALPQTVTIGALLSATGDFSSHGQDNNIAVQLALADFNDHLDSIEAPWRMSLVIEDTQSDPINALEKIQSLNSKGVSMIIGTETSAELRNIKPYADSNSILLISPSSTSPKLAIKDNIFRLIPDGTNQGRVIAELFGYHDIKVVVPVYRNDVWGVSMYTATKGFFEELGGTFDDGIKYSPDITVFSTESSLLSKTVEKYLESYEPDQVAVLIMGFSETVHFLNSANSYDTLHDVPWFGAASSSGEEKITNDPIASAFARNTGFVAPQFAVSENEKFEYVKAHINEKTGTSPSNYAYSAYDALWLLGLAVLDTGSTDADIIGAALPEIASKYSGAIGDIVLNDAGDLDTADYELWHVNEDGKWNLYGRYDAATNTIIVF